MRAHVKELHISVGLPASGKTTKFKELYKEVGCNGNQFLECDMFLPHRYKDMESLISSRSSIFYGKTYLDGLFLSKDDIARVLTICKDTMVKVDKVIIHYWNPDREKCTWNDLGRREKDSTITIVNAEIDDVKDIMKIKKDFPDIKFDKVIYDIVMKERWQIFGEENNFHFDENGMMRGDSWCTGGTWANCWGDGGSVSSDDTPEGMSELDDLLEKVAPSVSFLEYKKISGQCVYIDDYSDGDYYGGTTYHKHYMLDIKKLYNYLIENKLIEEII